MLCNCFTASWKKVLDPFSLSFLNIPQGRGITNRIMFRGRYLAHIYYWERWVFFKRFICLYHHSDDFTSLVFREIKKLKLFDNGNFSSSLYVYVQRMTVDSFVLFCFVFLASLHGMGNLSFPTWDQTHMQWQCIILIIGLTGKFLLIHIFITWSHTKHDKKTWI